MAVNISVNTITNITEYPNSFKRQGAFPLDRYSLFNSLSDAESYAQNNPIAYVGQELVVVDTSASPITVTMYVIESDNSLREVGSASISEDNIKSGGGLSLDDGKLSLEQGLVLDGGTSDVLEN